MRCSCSAESIRALVRLSADDFDGVPFSQVKEREHTFVGGIAGKRWAKCVSVRIGCDAAAGLGVGDDESLAVGVFIPKGNGYAIVGDVKRIWHHAGNGRLDL